MYCENCGKEIPDVHRLCADCQPAETPAEAPKKKGNGKKLVLGAIALVLVVAIVLTVVFWSNISIFFRRTFSDPAEYLADAEKKAMQESTSQMLEAYGHYRDVLTSQNQRISLELGARLNPNLGDLLEGSSQANGAVSFGLYEDLYQLELSASLTDEEAIGGTVTVDSANGQLWLEVPALSDQALQLDLETLGVEDENLDFDLGALGADLPTEKELKSLADTYTAVLVKHYKNVTSEEKTVTCGKVSQELLVMTVTFTEKELADLAADLLETVKTDKTTQDILSKLGDPDRVREEIDAALAELAQETGTEKALTMTVYLDGQDNIVGRSFAGDEGDLSWLILWDGSRFGARFASGQVVLEGSGKEKKSKCDGQFTLSVEGTPIVNMDAFDLAEGSGTFQISIAPEAITDSGELALVLSSLCLEAKLEDGVVTLSAEVMGMSMAEASIGVSHTECPPITPPENAFVAESEEDLETWLENADWDGFLEALEKAGFSADVVEDLF